MTCRTVWTPHGAAIVCGIRRRQRCRCGRDATLLCDWKVPGKQSGTCDAPICTACTTSPTPDKDLCRAHGEAYHAWRASRRATAARVSQTLCQLDVDALPSVANTLTPGGLG